MKSFVDQELTFTFLCDCGCIEFDRPNWAKNLKSFFEGSYECKKCKKKHDYTSTAFSRNHTQLELF